VLRRCGAIATWAAGTVLLTTTDALERRFGHDEALGGAFGILLGGLADLTVRAKYDLDEGELSDSLRRDLGQALPVARVGLLAQLGDEVDP
jgi:hypothetical protein